MYIIPRPGIDITSSNSRSSLRGRLCRSRHPSRHSHNNLSNLISFVLSLSPFPPQLQAGPSWPLPVGPTRQNTPQHGSNSHIHNVNRGKDKVARHPIPKRTESKGKHPSFRPKLTMGRQFFTFSFHVGTSGRMQVEIKWERGGRKKTCPKNRIVLLLSCLRRRT